MSYTLNVRSEEPLLRATEEDVQYILDSFGLKPQTIINAVEHLQEWMRLQPHLPKVSDPELLCRIWFRRKTSMELAKQVIDMYYTMRTLTPEFLTDRDPTSRHMQEAMKYMQFVTMPALTEDRMRICISRFTGTHPSQYDTNLMFKVMLMTCDVRLRSCFCLGEHVILDMKNCQLSLIKTITPVLLKKFNVCIMKGFVSRIKSIHFVNVPPFIDLFVGLVKSVFSSKMASRIKIHSDGFQTLHDHIPAKLLPKDYGGEDGTMDQHWENWKQKLVSQRDWFLEQENIKVDERKRPGRPANHSDILGIEGSFRKLVVD